jgi:preprotein translocase subunit SecE
MNSKLVMVLIMTVFVVGLYGLDYLLDKYNQDKD